ncbi:hypothetical protein [Magnetospirillum sp. UT-4]|uniref:hypothetical protein n=1 Tax=Magnetospirillum sp. UT-4 TaxID=2681467 RepID=UPI001386127D|nr:hypothetical protein [Magnetospirillum sp. UT-4]CAA7612908.1 exported hypothetical protein [Magnetospirillum sp. UT-4]
MGSFTQYIPMALQAASSVAGGMAQQQQAKASAQAQQQQMDLQNQMLMQQHEQQARQQRDLLKRQMATARASLSAGGIGFAGGSGGALLEGLTRQTASDLADSAATTRLRYQSMFPAQDSGGGGGLAGLQQGLGMAQQGFELFQSLRGGK